MATKIRYREENRIAYITFYEEEERKPCTLDWEVLGELEACIHKIEGRLNDIRTVILESASPKSFIVGANIAVLKTQTADNIADWVLNGHRIFNQLQLLPLPVIAKVARFALGGGLELAMSCDFIVAGENAQFGQPEASLGVMPGWGGSYRLPMLIGPNRAKEVFMTGRKLDARTAYEWGLVNRVCPEEDLDAVTEEIAVQIADNDAGVLAKVKRIIYDDYQKGILQNGFLEAETSRICMASEGTRQRLDRFFESRKK